MGMTIALNICVLEYGTALSINFLNKLRTLFLELWIQKNKDKEQANSLIDYQLKIYKQGLFEEYNYWLLMKGAQKEFDTWNENNPGKIGKNSRTGLSLIKSN